MGIYYDRGVQYMVVTNKRIHVIISLKEADNRLIETDYYKTRKESWFDSNGSFCNPIPDGEIDITMTDREKNILESVLKRVEMDSEVVERMGWYDIQNIYDTYGI